MSRTALACIVLALVGCGSEGRLVDVPSNHGRDLASALARLHAAGFKASFDSASTPCGDGLAIVPRLMGRDARYALGDLPRALWPCVRVRSAHSTSAGGLTVVAQSPRAGTRLPAYGVMIGRGYRPTTVSLTLAAR